VSDRTSEYADPCIHFSGRISPSRQRRAAASRRLAALTRIICRISRSRVTFRDKKT
jgi:hypothetical protein